MIVTTPDHCRVRIVNDITNQTTIVESPRKSTAIFADLTRMVRAVNRRRDQVLKASLHLFADGLIVLHWHCPSWNGDELSKSVLESAGPVYEVEKLIWKGESPA